MAIGPVQLIVLGFSRPDFHGEIIAELERLRENDMVRVIDSLAVYKDADGELEVEHLSTCRSGRRSSTAPSDGFISPLDLVEIGLVSAEEARELHELETAAAAS